MAQCCRCNRTGSCRRCACVKAGKGCSNCLPSKLGNCSNVSSVQAPPPSVATSTTNWSASTTVPDASTTSLRPAVSANRSSSSSSGIQSSASDSPCQCNSSISCSPPLPNFQPVSNPVFGWGSLDAESFSHALEVAYSEVVHWRSNSFKVPMGRVGKEFVNELSRLFSAFASSSSMESVALRATIVLPILLLQKPHRRSRAKDHTACLKRRLLQWKDGNLNELVREGRTIQSHLLKFNTPAAKETFSCSFANPMFAGKLRQL